MELGLSLAGVAQKDFSRAFLNQVELGRARPSTRILQIIAERLHRPVEYFLQDPQNSAAALEFRLAEAGTRIRQGDGVRARQLMSELLALSQITPQIRARAQLVLAEALLKLRAIPEAIEALQAAIKVSEAAGWRALSVELYDRMGTARGSRDAVPGRGGAARACRRSGPAATSAGRCGRGGSRSGRPHAGVLADDGCSEGGAGLHRSDGEAGG